MARRRVRSPSSRRPARVELAGALARVADPGILAVDARSLIVACSRVASRILRLENQEVEGRPVEVLPVPLRGLIEETFQSGHPVTGRPLVLHEETADRIVLRVSTLWVGKAGTPVGTVVLVLQDVGAAREVEARTGRMQQLASVGMLSAGVAHEIKNALVAVKTFTELLLEKQKDHETASLVRSEVNRIDTLITQLLRLAGPARAAFAPVGVHTVLHDALRLVQPQLKSRNIEEVVLLEARADQVLGDPRQLEQAFLNLLLNAVEAMPDGGQLVVHSDVVVATEHVSKFEPEARARQLQVELRDTGPGIPAEILPRLFTPFLTTKPGGTGLGLTITQRIIREHRGHIRVESRQGRGTTFRVVLPLCREGE